MKAHSKKASHLRAHTWKDIGGMAGLLLDGVFFAFLIVASVMMTGLGVIGVILAYLTWPIVTLLSIFKIAVRKELDDSILLDDGTLGTRRSTMPEPVRIKVETSNSR